MVSPQLNVRIPSELNQKLNIFVDKTNMSKTEIVVSALKYYMGFKKKDESLSQRLESIEVRLTKLELDENDIARLSLSGNQSNSY